MSEVEKMNSSSVAGVQTSPDGLTETQHSAGEERLRNALLRVKQVLMAPAAEYVPAISDAWDIIDVALNPEPEDQA